MNGLNWENLGVAFASSFLGSIVRMAGMKMDEKGNIITEEGNVLTMRYILKKTIFGVGSGVAFVGVISEVIGQEGFNWLLIIGFLIGYGGEHFLPVVIKAIVNFLRLKTKILINSDEKMDENKKEN